MQRSKVTLGYSAAIDIIIAGDGTVFCSLRILKYLKADKMKHEVQMKNLWI